MKNTLILVLVLVAMVAIYFVFVAGSGGTSFSKDDIAFSIQDTASITHIELIKVSREVEKEKIILEKRPDGTWMVNGDYVASQPKVRNLLAVMKSLIVKEYLTDKGQKNALEKLKKYHVDVRVSGENGLLKEYYIGSVNKDQTGNIMLLKGREIPHIMSKPGVQKGYISTYYGTELAQWRENLVFEIRELDLKRFKVTYQESGQGFELKRESPDAPWAISGAKEMNDGNLDEYLSLFSGKVFGESFAMEHYPGMRDSLSRKSPDARLDFETFYGGSGSVSLFIRPENPNSYFGWVGNEGELLTIQKFVIDKYLRTRGYFVEGAL